MRAELTVGLLPFYLSLYDDTMPERRAGFRDFLNDVEGRLNREGVTVVRADVCRVASEFARAVAMFEKKDVDCIVTLHLAYSPSLEAIDVLAETRLPIVMLDTTMDFDFGPDVEPDRIMYNHGIHGVMDLATMLRRRGKAYEITAGHVSESDAVKRAADMARAVCVAAGFGETRVLRMGRPFDGMGDFAVEESVLRDVLGIQVETVSLETLAERVSAVPRPDMEEEMECDRERFECDLPAAVHARSVKVSLGLRRLLEEGYDAFSMNFMDFDKGDGPANTVPFLEASKAMERGVGYAGEGDVLTAALVGSLVRAFGDATFTEIFCPDWKGDALFLSHMGEVNPAIAAEKPCLLEKPFPFTPAQNPAILTCAPRPGPAVFVNLAPGPNDSFSLIVARVEVLGDGTSPAMRNCVRGWIRPACGVREFLEAYSRHGGTHHSALVPGDRADAVTAFARTAGLDVGALL